MTLLLLLRSNQQAPQPPLIIPGGLWRPGSFVGSGIVPSRKKLLNKSAFIIKQPRGTKIEPQLIKHPFEVAKTTMAQIVPVQGKMPQSKEEFWVALALNKLGIRYTFQYPVGGYRLRGSTIIDFMIETRPLQTPLWVNGLYWHGAENMQSTLASIRETMRKLRGKVTTEIIIWDYEIPTEEVTLEVVRMRVGKGL